MAQGSLTSTPSLSGRNAAGKGNEYAYQGVQPWIEGESEVKKHAYYQWVPFVLFLQGVMFYVPHYLWKIFEDRKVDKITNGLRGNHLSPFVKAWKGQHQSASSN